MYLLRRIVLVLYSEGVSTRPAGSLVNHSNPAQKFPICTVRSPEQPRIFTTLASAVLLGLLGFHGRVLCAEHTSLLS